MSGYTFAGWASDANRTKVHNFDAAVEQNITLYAVWMPESGDLVHTVTYHANYVGDDQDHTVAVFTTTGNAVAAPDPGAGRIPAGPLEHRSGRSRHV